ncbi:MAG: hypothetical protein N2235_23375 [Fischerella sp.]|nr:hypothetical protein [Fischerella sp.]
MSEAIKTTPSKPISTKIVSNTPKRLRLRIASPHRQAEEMQRLAKALKAHPNIENVRMNIDRGSITIHHDGNDGSLENVLGTLKDIGIIFADIAGGRSEAAAAVSNTVVDLNKRVHKATNGTIDLRMLFPLGLATLSLRQLLTRGLQLEFIPWYVLAWYAFDSFIKLNVNGTSQSQSTQE